MKTAVKSIVLFTVIIMSFAILYNCSTGQNAHTEKTEDASQGQSVLTGIWSGSWSTSDQSYSEEIVLELNQENSTVSGSSTNAAGEHARVEGEVVENALELKIWNEDGSVIFSGTVADDSIEGDWVVGANKGVFTVARNAGASDK